MVLGSTNFPRKCFMSEQSDRDSQVDPSHLELEEYGSTITMDNGSRADRVTAWLLFSGVDHSCISDPAYMYFLYPLYQARIVLCRICDAVRKYLFSAFDCFRFFFLYRRTKS